MSSTTAAAAATSRAAVAVVQQSASSPDAAGGGGVVSSSTPHVAVRAVAAATQPQQVVVTTAAADPLNQSAASVVGFSDEDDDEDIGSDEDDEDVMEDSSSLGSPFASQLASAGPTGMAAAAAISSTKKRKRSHSFETNPSIRKRQQTRLLRKLKANIEEFSLRVGQQAVVVVATPGKAANNFRSFGAKPLEDVMRGLQPVIMTELENALSRQAPPSVAPAPDPDRHELPPLTVDGIPTPVEKMTQAQLRAFIPMMLKYSTGRGKPGWGKESTRPSWWPHGVPWANVRMDARLEDDKQKVSWTHALRQIVLNCYQFHNRDDLLPSFAEEDNEADASTSGAAVGPATPAAAVTSTPTAAATALVVKKRSMPGAAQPPKKLILATAQQQQQQQAVSAGAGTHFLATAVPQSGTVQLAPGATVVQTVSNPDGSISLVQLAENSSSNTLIQLPDGTLAQLAQLPSASDGQAGVHTLAEVATAVSAQQAEQGQQQQQHQTIELAGTATGELTADGHIIIAGEDGNAYPVALNGGMITVPVPQNMYQQVVANIQSGEGGVQVLGTQVQGVVTKVEEGTQPASSTAAAAAAHPRGLTITPVSTSAAPSAAGPSVVQVVSSSGAAGPQTRRGVAVATKSSAKK